MITDYSKVKFNEQGLIPAIVQDFQTKKILMMAYMNQESLQRTLETKKTWFYSRSRKKLWNKGETSGNFQIVKKVSLDCDGDTLLIEVIQKGNACHTGEKSCFFQTIYGETVQMEYEDIIMELYSRIINRKEVPKEGSYTNYLFEKGIDKILKKIGEESSEIIIAAKNNNHEETIYEIADFVYHLMVLMVERQITIDEIKTELKKRNKK